MNKGLKSIIECGLATDIELAESYAKYLHEQGKENEQPTDYITIDGITYTAYTASNINSKQYKYYKLVDLIIKQLSEKHTI